MLWAGKVSLGRQLCAALTWSHQRREACEVVSRAGDGEGTRQQGGRGERERQRAGVGRCGLGPEEGRDRAARCDSWEKQEGGEQAAGLAGSGGGGGGGGRRSRQPLDQKRSRLHSRFFGSHLSTPSTAPHRFLSFETPGEMPTFPSPSYPGGVSPQDA